MARKKRGRKEPGGTGKLQGSSFVNRPFAKIAKVAGKTEPSPASERTSKPPIPAVEPASEVADDDELFVSAMGGVAPLEDEVERVAAEAKARPLLAEMDDAELVMRHLDDLVHGDTPFDFSDTDEFIEASVAGLDWKIRRKLKRGDYSFEAHLDLHGYTKDQARRAVDEFIRRCHRDGKRCVLLVHGRGKGSKDNIPVLKNKLAAWLTRGAIGKLVLAYVSARPYDGGTGAVYVLLRSGR